MAAISDWEILGKAVLAGLLGFIMGWEREAHGHARRSKRGTPPQKRRSDAGAILSVLRTGSQWKALPRELGASTTVYDRYRFWLDHGCFHQMGAAGLSELDELVGIEWEWQSLDGAMTKAPFDNAATEAYPIDRSKRGTIPATTEQPFTAAERRGR